MKQGQREDIKGSVTPKHQHQVDAQVAQVAQRFFFFQLTDCCIQKNSEPEIHCARAAVKNTKLFNT